MHTLTTFYAKFPEFKDADSGNPAAQDALVQANLDEAALQIDQSVWLALSTAGHGYLTAHMLALSPLGNTAKLVAASKLGKGGMATTTYEVHYLRLLRSVTAGLRST